uniref:Uncharacterized protein n=1 Tax=Timema poppense TaxID=170557 RepID=A0A7R9HDM2_TIMPO|nr:unnamed protein product [Timema poppensis]
MARLYDNIINIINIINRGTLNKHTDIGVQMWRCGGDNNLVGVCTSTLAGVGAGNDLVGVCTSTLTGVGADNYLVGVCTSTLTGVGADNYLVGVCTSTLAGVGADNYLVSVCTSTLTGVGADNYLVGVCTSTLAGVGADNYLVGVCTSTLAGVSADNDLVGVCTSTLADVSADNDLVGVCTSTLAGVGANTDTNNIDTCYDWNRGVNYSKLLETFRYSGFQATNFGLAVEEINKMWSFNKVESTCLIDIVFDLIVSCNVLCPSGGYGLPLLGAPAQGHGTDEIQLECRQTPLPEDEMDIHEEDEFIRRRSNCTIFLGYTSNMVSAGVRDTIRFLVQHRMVRGSELFGISVGEM